jgi:hypothetical protein
MWGLLAAETEEQLEADYQADLLKFLDYVAWGVTAICAMAVLLVAGRLAMVYRTGNGEGELLGLAWIAAACVLVGSAGAIVGGLI